MIASRHEIQAVVTQPDKPKGRKGELTPSPVKVIAKREGIKVYQPLKVRDEEFVKTLRAYNPDVMVVVAFGQIIPLSILQMPKYGCVNIHGSLLPKYRGAAPIQWAVLDGEKETGITTILMDEGIDTGDILLKKTIKIDADETSGSLFDKLMALGAKTILETLDELEKGNLTPTKQGESPTAYAKMLTKAMGLIDFTKSAKELDCFVRGMDPWPSAYTLLAGKTLKLWKVRAVEKSGKAGSVIGIDKESFTVACGEGAIEVLEVQLEGKKRMSAGDFLKGSTLKDTLDSYLYLDKSSRGFITRLYEGTIEKRLYLDYIIDGYSKTPVKKMKPIIMLLLEMAVYQLFFMDRVPDSAAINEAVKLTKKRGLTGLSGFVNGVLRNIARNKESIVLPDKNKDIITYLEIKYSTPKAVVEYLIKDYGNHEAEAILEAFEEKRPLVARATKNRE